MIKERGKKNQAHLASGDNDNDLLEYLLRNDVVLTRWSLPGFLQPSADLVRPIFHQATYDPPNLLMEVNQVLIWYDPFAALAHEQNSTVSQVLFLYRHSDDLHQEAAPIPIMLKGALSVDRYIT